MTSNVLLSKILSQIETQGADGVLFDEEKPTFATVLYDFTAEDVDELTVTEGEIVQLLIEPQPEWTMCLQNKTSKTGYIPTLYFEVLPPTYSPIENFQTKNVDVSPMSPSSVVLDHSSETEDDPMSEELPSLETATKTATEAAETEAAEVTKEDEQIPKEKQKLSKKDKVIQEILKTETYYVNGLSFLERFYIGPIKLLDRSETRLMDSKDFDLCFRYIRVISLINTELLKYLECIAQGTVLDSDPSVKTVGQLFIKLSPMFKAYASYMQQYDKIRETISVLMKTNKRFATFVKGTEKKLKQEHGVQFFDLMISPVQRLPRYNLLLKELLSSYEKDSLEYQELQQALKTTESVSAHVNEYIRVSEHKTKFSEIMKSNDLKAMGEDLVEPTRLYIMEAVMKKYKTGLEVTTAKRHVYLFSDMILICAKSKYLAHIKFTEVPRAYIVHSGENTADFEIVSQQGVQHLKCSNPEEKMRWVQEISNLMQKIVEKNPKLSEAPLAEKSSSKVNLLNNPKPLTRSNTAQQVNPSPHQSQTGLGLEDDLATDTFTASIDSDEEDEESQTSTSPRNNSNQNLTAPTKGLQRTKSMETIKMKLLLGNNTKSSNNSPQTISSSPQPPNSARLPKSPSNLNLNLNSPPQQDKQNSLITPRSARVPEKPSSVNDTAASTEKISPRPPVLPNKPSTVTESKKPPPLPSRTYQRQNNAEESMTAISQPVVANEKTTSTPATTGSPFSSKPPVATPNEKMENRKASSKTILLPNTSGIVGPSPIVFQELQMKLAESLRNRSSSTAAPPSKH